MHFFFERIVELAVGTREGRIVNQDWKKINPERRVLTPLIPYSGFMAVRG